MIKKLIKFIRGDNSPKTSSYEGFSDFFLRAPARDKERVMKEAAYRANSDQRKVVEEARLKIQTNG